MADSGLMLILGGDVIWRYWSLLGIFCGCAGMVQVVGYFVSVSVTVGSGCGACSGFRLCLARLCLARDLQTLHDLRILAKGVATVALWKLFFEGCFLKVAL